MLVKSTNKILDPIDFLVPEMLENGKVHVILAVYTYFYFKTKRFDLVFWLNRDDSRCPDCPIWADFRYFNIIDPTPSKYWVERVFSSKELIESKLVRSSNGHLEAEFPDLLLILAPEVFVDDPGFGNKVYEGFDDSVYKYKNLVRLLIEECADAVCAENSIQGKTQNQETERG